MATKVCEYCKKYPKTNQDALKICSQCNITGYCDRECQLNDWKKNKPICKSILSSQTQKILNYELSMAPLRQLQFDCERGYLPGIQTYISSGANINVKLGDEELTPLLVSCVYDNDTCVSFLLVQNGADPNITDKANQTTPLIAASASNHDKCVLLLLQHGADPNISNKDQATPLYMASEFGNDKCVSLLLQHGADPNISRIADQRTPLFTASEFGYDKCLELLLQHDAEPNAYDTNDQQAALHIASKVGHLKCVTLLVEHGADINKTDCSDRTALMLCAVIGKVNVLSYLLSHGANIHATDIDGMTAVQLAHVHGRSDSVAKLIEHGADESSLEGLEFGSETILNSTLQKAKELRRDARYCEYTECSSNKNSNEKNVKKLLTCTRCQMAHYCSVEHQKLHWKEHKKICKALL